MTSDSYNVQTFIRAMQTLGVRAPILLVGGIAVTLTMDAALASILCVMAPVLICVVIFVSWRGIPLYDLVQRRLDTVVRVMRRTSPASGWSKPCPRRTMRSAASTRPTRT